MSESLHLWLAVSLVGISFAAFAWIFIGALYEGTGNYASQMGEKTSREFEDVFMFISAKKISDLGLIGAAASFFVFFIPLLDFSSAISTVMGIVLGLGAGLFVFFLPGKYVQFLRQKRKDKFNQQLVEALGSMANSLRAGFSINQAFESIVQTGDKPISQEFNVFLQQLRVGMSFEEALNSMERRVQSDDLTLVCTSIDIARKTGGNLTEIFDRISETIRGRMRIESRVKTLTAQGRFQGLIVSLLPVALGIILTAIKPSMMIPFFMSVKGMLAVGAMFALITIGWLIIRKIIKIDV
ncbi:MAG: type II secretion system F family protein [Kiritimatiellae bacterium]|nr:type II secretion system F family protein [Kiritimatiellia bacterium]